MTWRLKAKWCPSLISFFGSLRTHLCTWFCLEPKHKAGYWLVSGFYTRCQCKKQTFWQATFQQGVVSSLCLTQFDLKSNIKWDCHISSCFPEMFWRTLLTFQHVDLSGKIKYRRRFFFIWGETNLSIKAVTSSYVCYIEMSGLLLRLSDSSSSWKNTIHNNGPTRLKLNYFVGLTG